MPTSRIQTWNTGRMYSGKGQRIAAIAVDDKIAFADIDRGIDGVLMTPYTGDPDKLQGFVMAEYDMCNYVGGLYTLENGSAILAQLKQAASLAIIP